MSVLAVIAPSRNGSTQILHENADLFFAVNPSPDRQWLAVTCIDEPQRHDWLYVVRQDGTVHSKRDLGAILRRDEPVVAKR